MGEDKLRYVYWLEGRWRWVPTPKMRAHGFRLVTFGREFSVGDRSRAVALNSEWDAVRTGRKFKAGDIEWPPNSVGEAYARAMKLREMEREAKKIEWTSEQASRDDWPRAWKHLGPAIGDCDPNLVTPEFMLELHKRIAAEVSESEAFRTIKVWRALWKRMAGLKLCKPEHDPSLQIANTAPLPRQSVWRYHEALKLTQRAWRMGYPGLAAVIATAWDTMLSPVDVRRLTTGQGVRDEHGAVFFLDRAKTGRAAAGTLTRWSEAIVNAYLEHLKLELTDNAFLFRNRSGLPYSKDTLGDDFRVVRAATFGADDRRQLADMRRSGAGEAILGGTKAEQLSGEMANTLSASNRLFKTYVPVDVEVVRTVDRVRTKARQRNVEQTKSLRSAGQKSKGGEFDAS